MISKLILLTVSVFAVGLSAPVRGVQKVHSAKFDSSAERFTCLDGSGEFSMSFVNDEFCDCVDGSDEPGTAACSLQTRNNPTWRFQCADTTYSTKEILHSFVNDGICDCCDGSDEYHSSNLCTNTCAEAFEKAEREREIREAVRQEGLKARDLLVQKSRSIRDELREKATNEQSNIARLDSEVLEAENEEKRTEALELKARQEVKEKSEAAFEVWKNEQSAKKKLAEENSKLNPEPEENSQIICAKWRQTADCSATGERQPSEDKECDVVVQDGHSGFCECVDSETGSEIRFDFDCGHKPLRCSYVCGHNGAEPETTETVKEETFTVDDGSKFDLPEAAAARQTVREKRRQRDDANNKLKEIENDLSRDYGPDDALLPLKGQCFELDQREYTYKLCPFSEVVQQRKGSYHGPIMGRFKSFGEQSYSSWGAKQDYTHMKFSEGEQCWGGPQRSTDVHLVCGAHSELVSVEEPSMCTYKMVFHTPAVCE